MSAESTEKYKQLFLLISLGDEQAFTELFHEYTPKLLPFITKLTRNETMARELVQETFLQLWVNREALDKIENPNSWIYRIASNLSLNWLKIHGNRRRILQTVPLKDTADSLSDILDSKELDLIIQKAVSLLPEKRQEVYRLSREQGLSHQQICDQLGIAPYTVKNQIGQALKFIQEYISKETGLSIITIMILFGR